MMNLEQATQLKEIIEGTAANNILTHSQKMFPFEACGFVLEDGVVVPSYNSIEALNNPVLTKKNAFLINKEGWQAAMSLGKKILGIWHSHTDGSIEMSNADKKFLLWPDLCYIIVGLVDHNPTGARLYWWDKDILEHVEITL